MEKGRILVRLIIKGRFCELSVSGVEESQETGYVVVMRPSFRERITMVLDTRRLKRISVHAAFDRGIAGIESGEGEIEDDLRMETKRVEEEQLSEDEQKKRFFVYDTARGVKLNFSEALKAGIIHYDSSATESIVFDEYAK